MKKLEKIKIEVKKYFNDENIIFTEVTEGRTNVNFFIKTGNKEYFLRTCILKVKDDLFGGLLKKEKDILEQIQGKGISPELIYSFDDGNISFLIIQKINGINKRTLFGNLDKIKKLLFNFQKLDINKFDFLDKISLRKGYRSIIFSRNNKIKDKELKEINNKMINFLFLKKHDFKDKCCLVHNDFRLDNIIITKDRAYLIDIEGLSIGDSYLDMGEYYVGGIFWDVFEDKKDFSFEEFSKLMNSFGYKNKEKQLFVFILKFCSNFSWLSSYIGQNLKIEKVYLKSIERNKKHFYNNIKRYI